MARGDELPDPDLIGDVREHRAQTALVAPVGRRRDAEDPAHRIELECGVDDAPIAVGGRVMRLVEHTVTVCHDGYEWQGRPYRSISAIARAITGTRWNGWVFFGIKNARRRP